MIDSLKLAKDSYYLNNIFLFATFVPIFRNTTIRLLICLDFYLFFTAIYVEFFGTYFEGLRKKVENG
jgi:hypothetical protein